MPSSVERVTTVDDRSQDSPGQTSSSTAHPPTHWIPELAIVTGALGPIWQQLPPEDERYPKFRWALMWQEGWSYGEHLTFWQTHLSEWPRVAAKPSHTGLVAHHVAIWLRDGYSQAQIARALGYEPGNAPKALWLRARDYLDWCRRQPFQVSGLTALATLEDGFARGVDHQTPDATEQARRQFRRRWRTPRVVTLDDWALSPFGWPEQISTQLLYGEVELQRIERAKQHLCEQQPYHAAAAAARVG